MKKVSVVFQNKIRLSYATDEKIFFSDESFIDFNHDADCCENNYADFTSVNDSILLGVPLERLDLEASEYGFLLNGYLVNCYSEQNGYYSDEVSIYYKNKYGGIILALDTTCELVD